MWTKDIDILKVFVHESFKDGEKCTDAESIPRYSILFTWKRFTLSYSSGNVLPFPQLVFIKINYVSSYEVCPL